MPKTTKFVMPPVKLSLPQAIRIIERAQDTRYNLLKHLAELKREAPLGPPGRRRYSTLEEINNDLARISDSITEIRKEIETLQTKETSQHADQIIATAYKLGIEIPEETIE